MEYVSVSRRTLLATLGAAALAGTGALRLRAAPNYSLSLGSQYTFWGLVDIVGTQEKLFEKAGVNLDVRIFDSGKSTRDAILAGRLDTGVLGATPFIVGAAKGPMAALGTVAYAGATIAVVAGSDTGIKNVSDLKGKRIATQVGSSTHHVFESKIAPKYGLKPGDYQIINVKFADLGAALASKSVEAFAGDEPQPAIAEYKGFGHVLVTYDEFVKVPVILGVYKPTVEKNPDAIVAFLKGWLEAVRVIHDQPERAAHDLWKVFSEHGIDLPEPVVLKSMRRLKVDPNYEPGLKDYLTETAEALRKDGQIDKIPDWDKVLLTEPLAAAMKG